jgi:hypothetical protein
MFYLMYCPKYFVWRLIISGEEDPEIDEKGGAGGPDSFGDTF